MIWLGVALGTEVFVTLVASDSEVGHVLCCLWGDQVSLVIFLSLNDITWHQSHDIST